MPPKRQNKVVVVRPPGQGLSKTARRKRRNRASLAKPKQITTPYRTTDTVERELRRAMAALNSHGNNKSEWAMCRMNPWGAHKYGLLPDGSNDSRLLSDYYSYTDIICPGTCSFQILTLPALPYNGLFRSLGSTGNYSITPSFNGTVLSAGTRSINSMQAITTALTSSGNFVPINPNSWIFGYVDDPTVSDTTPYISTNKVRITSMGWRLVYTGSAASASGLITVTSSPASIDSYQKTGGIVNIPSANGVAALTNLNAGTNPMSIEVLTPFTAGFTSNTSKEVMTFRPENCPRGVVKHNGATFTWKPIWDTPHIIVTAQPGVSYMFDPLTSTTAAAANQTTPTTASTMPLGTVNFLDLDWDCTSIVATNVTGAFRFETWTCYEIIPDQSSAFSAYATKATESLPNVVARVEADIANSPVAQGSSTNKFG